ncbi:MAG: CBS domain-containing protein [Aquihabitans sp.]
MSRNSLVSTVMTSEVLAFSPTDTVADAMDQLLDRSIAGAPVVDVDGQVVGVLTTGDLIVQESRIHFPTIISIFGATLELPSAKRDFEDDLRRTLGSTVADVMQPDPITIGPDDTVEEAATLMHRHDISRLPVVGDSGLVGIVTRVDILRGIVESESESEAEG